MADWLNNDREVLARTLMAEAGNQGAAGMLAAGSVIMNRANTSGYGTGVRGVILKPGQFSPWNSVTGYAGGEQGQDMSAIRPSAEAYAAADALLSGNYTDPTNGATHFYNPDISNPSWGQRSGGNWNKIGDHVFGQADAGRSTFGGNTVEPQNGLLGAPAPAMQGINPEQRQPFYKNPDFLDNLVLGLGGLTMRPNVGLMEAARGRIQGRREDQQTAQQRNATASWLATQGAPDLAEGVQTGAITGADALSIYQSRKAAPSDERTSLIKNFEYAKSTGYEGSFDDFLRSGGGGGNTINMPGAPTIGTIPPGYQAIQDQTTGQFRLEVLPGGPAEVAAQTAQAEADAASQAASASAAMAQNSIELIDSVMNDPALASVTGMIEGRLPPMTQDGTDLVVKIEQLQGQAFLQAFESLKGGGAITEREGIAAQDAIARLNRAQSTRAFQQALTEMKSIMEIGRRRAAGENIPDTGGVLVGEPY